MDCHEMFDNLFKWLLTFECSSNVSSVQDLNSGVVIAKVLHSIVPDFFTDTLLNQIKPDTGSNWRLKVSNLKKILRAIREFYSEYLEQQLLDKEMPDVNGIGEQCSVPDLACLLQLVLGVAVACVDKEKYIQVIMGMEETVQQSLMLAIKEVMERPRLESDVDDRLKRAVEETYSANKAKEEMVQRCHELDYQISVLQEEKAALVMENERFVKRVEQLEASSKNESTSTSRIVQFEEQIEVLQEELFALEATKEEYKSRCEQLEKEKEELVKLGGDLSYLRDELDILRGREAEHKKTATAFEQLKKKVDEGNEAKRQLKLVEEQSSEQLKRCLQLEEDVRRLSTFKTQADALKEQGAESQKQLSEARRHADKAEFELSRHTEKYVLLEQELRRLREDRDCLQEKCDEFELQSKLAGTEHSGSAQLQDDDPEFLSLPLSIKERLLRLEGENARLRGGQEEKAAGELAASQALLYQAEQRLACLETENRDQSHQILALNSKIGDAADSHAVQELRRQVSELQAARQQSDAELRRQKTYIEELEGRTKSATEKLRDVSDRLAKREEELRQQDDKYRRLLDRAKNVIRMQMDAKSTSVTAQQQGVLSGSSSGTAEVAQLKAQLLDKDRVIEQMEQFRDRNSRDRDAEDQRMVSAWYSLGMQLHQGVGGEFGSHSSPGQSFLQRQRSANSKTSLNHVQVNVVSDRSS